MLIFVIRKIVLYVYQDCKACKGDCKASGVTYEISCIQYKTTYVETNYGSCDYREHRK